MAKDNRKLTITKHPTDAKFYNIDLSTNIADETTLETLLGHYNIVKDFEEVDYSKPKPIKQIREELMPALNDLLNGKISIEEANKISDAAAIEYSKHKDNIQELKRDLKDARSRTK
jgi:hypothetical protein